MISVSIACLFILFVLWIKLYRKQYYMQKLWWIFSVISLQAGANQRWCTMKLQHKIEQYMSNYGYYMMMSFSIWTQAASSQPNTYRPQDQQIITKVNYFKRFLIIRWIILKQKFLSNYFQNMLTKGPKYWW